MGLQHNFSAQRLSLRHDCIKVFNLEPDQNPMPMRCGVSVYQVGMILFVPGMELENQFAVREDSIIDVAVGMVRERIRSEQLLIPAAARFNIANANQWLWTHASRPPEPYELPTHAE